MRVLEKMFKNIVFLQFRGVSIFGSVVDDLLDSDVVIH